MGEVRTSLIVLLAGLMGCLLGAAALGFVQGGIHSDWSLVVAFGIPVCAAAGGVAGAKGAVRLVKRRWLQIKSTSAFPDS